jgi:hypothetical protein
MHRNRCKTVADGEACPVLTRGRVKVKAGAAITRGKAVYAGDASKLVLMLDDQAVDESGAASYSIYYNRKFATALNSALGADDLIFINVER